MDEHKHERTELEKVTQHTESTNRNSTYPDPHIQYETLSV